MVVGAGGMLGRAVVRALTRRGRPCQTIAVTWNDQEAAVHTLRSSAARVAAERGWCLIWCAGAGVTATPPEYLANELTSFRRTLDGLAQTGVPGTLFVASSAGGVYAGSAQAPYTERHVVRPLSPYGDAKLTAEEAAFDFGLATGSNVLVGRISNLYGPGQNLQKAQGLISQLCLSYLTRRQTAIYVSLDTIRDYIFVDDCARLILDGLDLVATRSSGTPILQTKILASQHGTTIASLIGEFRRLFKRRPQIILGTSASAGFQVRDLRMRSIVFPELDRHEFTPLPVGIAATAAGLRAALQQSNMG